MFVRVMLTTPLTCAAKQRRQKEDIQELPHQVIEEEAFDLEAALCFESVIWKHLDNLDAFHNLCSTPML